MIPVGDTRRTRPAPASAIKKLPSGSTATPIGSLKLAAVAGPPSPESPNQPVPACARPAGAGRPDPPWPGHGADRPVGNHPPHPVVARVGDQVAAVGHHRDPERLVERSRGGRAARAGGKTAR